MQTFKIPGQLPGMNKIIAASKTHHMVYKKIKEEHCWYIGTCIKKHNITPYTDGDLPINVKITWVCENKKRDKDNIMAGQKFILDAMVKSGVIKDDGWKYIGEIEHKFMVEKNNPHVIIELTDKEEINGQK